MSNLKLHDGTVRCVDCMDASSYDCETDESCAYCGTYAVTHIGDSPASAGCNNVMSQDMFSSDRNSVDCNECLDATQRVIKHGQRYQVDYDESRHSWGVVDTYDLKNEHFVSHTTTLAGARVQRRRLAQQRYAWTQ